MSKKRLAIILAATALIIALAVGLVTVFLSRKDSAPGSPLFFWSADGDCTYYTLGSRLGHITLQGKIVSVRITDDGKCAAVASENGHLWHVSDGAAFDIGGSNGSFSLAFSSGDVYFIDGSKLMRFDFGKQRVEEIQCDFEPTSVVASPNGRSLVVSKNGVLMLYNGRDFTKLHGSQMECLAVSDNGLSVYALSEEGALYFLDGKKRNKIATEVVGKPIFSADSKNVIFVSSGKIYMSNNGGDKIPLADSSDNGEELFLCGDAVVSDFGNCRFYKVASFKNQIVSDGKSIVYIGDGNSAEAVISDIARTADPYFDGESLTYVKNGILYRAGIGKLTSPDVLAPSAVSFAIDPDSERFYYITPDGTLISNSNGNENELGENISSVTVGEGVVFFLGDGGKLYASTDGVRRVMLNDGVAELQNTRGGIFYLKSERRDHSLYMLGKGYSFRRLADGISGAVE